MFSHIQHQEQLIRRYFQPDFQQLAPCSQSLQMSGRTERCLGSGAAYSTDTACRVYITHQAMRTARGVRLFSHTLENHLSVPLTLRAWSPLSLFSSLSSLYPSLFPFVPWCISFTFHPSPYLYCSLLVYFLFISLYSFLFLFF